MMRLKCAYKFSELLVVGQQIYNIMGLWVADHVARDVEIGTFLILQDKCAI